MSLLLVEIFYQCLEFSQAEEVEVGAKARLLLSEQLFKLLKVGVLAILRLGHQSLLDHANLLSSVPKVILDVLISPPVMFLDLSLDEV